jgi:hypothetical protein
LIESFLFGVGGKLVSNLVNSWLKGGQDTKKDLAHSHQSASWIKAQTAHLRESNKDQFARLSRFIIYIMMASTFCFIAIYAMIHPTQTDVLVKTSKGLSGMIFRQPEAIKESVHISGVVFKDCLQVIIAVLGALVTPSTKG